MAWFGRKAAGAAPRPALVRGIGAALAGGGGGWPQGYDAQLRDGALTNPVALRAVRLVAEGAAGVVFYAGGADQRAAKLLSPELVEAAATHLLLHGNAFLKIVEGGDGAPAELFALRPERVTVETDARGWPAAYRYRAGEAAMRLPAVDAAGRPPLVHIRAANPTDDHYGLGCLGAAASAVALHNAATRWNRALLDNAARPSGALVYDPGEAGAALSPEQFARLREEMEASFAGTANAGRPMLLEGGLRWQAMSMTPADMDFVSVKATAAREIALAFGVPPMLLGLPGDNSYANYREANRALWRLTILPIATRLASAVSGGIAGWWPDAAIRIDHDAIPALAEDRERLWSMVSAAPFLNDGEKREMLGFDPVPVAARAAAPAAGE